jgi:hypothetical protein
MLELKKTKGQQEEQKHVSIFNISCMEKQKKKQVQQTKQNNKINT